MRDEPTTIDFPIEIPNYRILRVLGYGGMARVFLAEQQHPSREVVIKLVSPDNIQNPDPEIREKIIARLQQEGDIAARFNHPNLVTVHECGIIEGHYFLAMEYLSGGDLRERMKLGLNPTEALNIIRRVAEGLSEMHARGMLHRDLKPENILFNERGHPVLADFGIAKETETVSTLTALGLRSGTPAYMSPEHAGDTPMDARSDLYSLGIVLYEMLTERPRSKATRRWPSPGRTWRTRCRGSRRSWPATSR